MTDEELRNRLYTPTVEDTIILPAEDSSTDPIAVAAVRVMESYQNANKWLDSVKEILLMDLGCVFFSNYVHELAHTMPTRFDKFGDILHIAGRKVPYPATGAIPTTPKDINESFKVVFEVVQAISLSLRAFIKAAQDSDYHVLACSTEELLVDIEKEHIPLHRMKKVYDSCNDSLKFDTWVSQYVSNLDKLID